MLKDWFGKSKYVTVKISGKLNKKNHKNEDGRLWTKCPGCKEIIFNKKLLENLMVCPKCNYHIRLSARDRLQITVDENSFNEFGEDLKTNDVIEFPGYKNKLDEAIMKTGLKEAVLTGEATIDNYPVVIAIMDFNFMGGSMGTVAGEKITLAIEKAIEEKKPLIIFSAAGGARMQEGTLSLMQMAKTSAAIKKLNKKGILYISVLTDPTSGGVTASFASLGDIIMSEPGALIAFAGPRVIKQTISTKLPEGFQRAEFLLEHGMIDLVSPRHEMRGNLARLLKMHNIEVTRNAQ